MATFTTKAFCQTLSLPSLCIFLTHTSYICFPLSYINSQSRTSLFYACFWLSACLYYFTYEASIPQPLLNYFFLYTSIFCLTILSYYIPKWYETIIFLLHPFSSLISSSVSYFALSYLSLFPLSLSLSLSHFPPPVLSFVSLTPSRSWTKTLWGNSLVLCNKLCCLWPSTLFYENHVRV